jgi:hypothetical protein
MSRKLFLNGLAAAAAIMMCAAPVVAAPMATREELVAQVRAAETAFAATMAARDHAAFGSFLAEDTVFFGANGPLRGAATVMEAWKRFYTGPGGALLVEARYRGSARLRHAGPDRRPGVRPAGPAHRRLQHHLAARARRPLARGVRPGQRRLRPGDRPLRRAGPSQAHFQLSQTVPSAPAMGHFHGTLLGVFRQPERDTP